MDFGYGIDLSRASFCDGAAEYVMRNFASKSLQSEFYEWRHDYPEYPDDYAMDEFVREYTDDIHCADGIEAVIVRCINDNECAGKDVFLYDDYCIYVGARIPRDDSDKRDMKTMEDIQKILTKYCGSHVLREPINIEFLEIHD